MAPKYAMAIGRVRDKGFRVTKHKVTLACTFVDICLYFCGHLAQHCLYFCCHLPQLCLYFCCRLAQMSLCIHKIHT